jgi:lipopolysaccharide transport system permease protein
MIQSTRPTGPQQVFYDPVSQGFMMSNPDYVDSPFGNVLGIISARFRDMPPIISSVTTIGFFVTPVMWSPDLIGNNELAHLLLGLNPFYHWLQIVRLPILGQWPTLENWGVALLVAGVGWGLTLLVYRRFRTMIAYWV